MRGGQYIPATREALSEHLLQKKGQMTWKSFAEHLKVPLVTVMWWRRGGLPGFQMLSKLGLSPSLEVINDMPLGSEPSKTTNARFIPATGSAIAKHLEKKRGRKTWAAFAAELGTTRVSVGVWRSGRGLPSTSFLQPLGLSPCFRILNSRPIADDIPPSKEATKAELLAENDRLMHTVKRLEREIHRLRANLRVREVESTQMVGMSRGGSK